MKRWPFSTRVRHLAVEKGQQQSANVRAVHVGIGHDDDGMIAQLRRIVVFLYARAESGNHQANFLGRKHLVETRFFDIEDLSLKRQYRLIAPIAALFGRAAGGITLDKVEFAQSRISFLAIGQLAGQASRSPKHPCVAPDPWPCGSPLAPWPLRRL